MTQGAAELFDLGYQHYDGPREGRMRTRTAVFLGGVMRPGGLGRLKAKPRQTITHMVEGCQDADNDR